ncbi:SMP-30/gluconolactonase/LRE family protein [Aldersonia kunmingensis]|uniref:SMP-30/gluconolactonase/LRE family protein n=1 Tax=Aldersonia kunmingensis TaxID=408066 RepID=UPI000833A17B|nr:SMP-30/gluconolactonase/LRE family protein [Aldersonia kunmingensis]
MTAPTALDSHPFIDGFVYGEGPRWHADRLWFTDGPAGKVYSVGEGEDLTVEAEVERPSGLGWLPDGTLVVSSLFAAKIHHVDAKTNAATTFDISDVAWSTNDLLVTPGGYAYVDLYREGGGAIGFVDRSGAVRVVADGLELPNGMCVLPDGQTLVVSETGGSRISSFRIEPDGSLGARGVFADLGPERHPDGLCVDAEGAVWVGCYDTGEFLRVMQGGNVTHLVEIEGGWAVAPALGGADGRTLYMVVDDTTHEGLMAGESTGWVVQTRVDVPGAGSP